MTFSDTSCQSSGVILLSGFHVSIDKDSASYMLITTNFSITRDMEWVHVITIIKTESNLYSAKFKQFCKTEEHVVKEFIRFGKTVLCKNSTFGPTYCSA